MGEMTEIKSSWFCIYIFIWTISFDVCLLEERWPAYEITQNIIKRRLSFLRHIKLKAKQIKYDSITMKMIENTISDSIWNTSSGCTSHVAHHWKNWTNYCLHKKIHFLKRNGKLAKYDLTLFDMMIIFDLWKPVTLTQNSNWSVECKRFYRTYLVCSTNGSSTTRFECFNV